MTTGQDQPSHPQPQVGIQGDVSTARDFIGRDQHNLFVLGGSAEQQRAALTVLREFLSTEGTELRDSADAEPGTAGPCPAAQTDDEPALLVQAADGRRLRLSAAEAVALREAAAASDDLDDYLAATIADQRCAQLAQRWVPLAGTLTEQARPAGWAGIEPELVALVAEGEGAGRRIRRERLGDVTEAMQRPAWVLLGEPGGGKTTTLNRLLVSYATGRLQTGAGLIPLFLPLAAYQDQPTPLVFVRERWRETLPNVHVGLDELLAQGKLLLLCDAINEMPFAHDDDLRARIRAWEGFAERWAPRGNRFVFSCRTRDYTEVLGLPQVEIARLDDDRVRRFLGNYLSADLAAAAWARLDGAPLLELVRNPYYLYILCWLVATGGAWPASRADLLAGFALHLLGREEHRGHADWPGRTWLACALTGLADGMQALGEGTRLPRAEAVARLAAAAARQNGADADAPDNSAPEPTAPDGDTLLRLCLAATLLDQEGTGERAQVRFYHHQLQEYFAARALLAADAAGVDLARRWRVPCAEREMPDPGPLRPDEPLPPPPGTGWEEPTLIAAALLAAGDAAAAPGEPAGAAAAFIDRVRAHNPVLAARCLTQPGLPPTALPVLGVEAVGDLLDGGANERNDTSVLADAGPLAAEAAATRAALLAQQRERRNHRRARIAAGDALGRLGDPRFRVVEVDGLRFIPPPLVSVPPGVVRIGTGLVEVLRLRLRGWYESDERPAHRLRLPAFRIGRFPVTNAEYRCFMAAGGYADDRWWDTDAARAWRRGELNSGRVDTIMGVWRQVKANPDLMRRQGWPEYQIQQWEKVLAMDEDPVRALFEQSEASRPMDRPAFWDDPRFDNPCQPVVGVNWLEARAYGRWLGDCLGRAAGVAGGAGMDLPQGACRLPTEAEWERAARAGARRRPYPWPGRGGFSGDRANCVEGQVLATTPVGCYPAGAGALGIEDLAGNCWEWCASRYAPYPVRPGDGRDDPAGTDRRVLRGGAWNSDRRHARSASRRRFDPDDFNYFLGFRLVLSLADAEC